MAKRKTIHKPNVSAVALPADHQAYIRKDLVDILRVTSIICGISALCIGLIALVGWYINNELFKSLVPGLPTMKTNAAIAFVLGGAAIVLYQKRVQPLAMQFVRLFCAISVSIIGILTLAQYVAGVNLGIDELVFREGLGSLGTISPNRMAPNSAILFSLIGWALVYLENKHNQVRFSQIVLLLSLVILMPTLIGYIFDIEFIYGIASSTKIALPSAIAFLLLIIGGLSLRASQGFMAIFTSPSSGGFLARRIPVISILLPLTVSWFILQGYRIGLYDTQFRFILQTVISVLLFTIAAWRMALALQKADLRERRYALNREFLVVASKVLASSMNYKTTLNSVAQLAVPHIADYCSVDIVDTKGKLQLLALAHIDPKKVAWARKLRQAAPPEKNEYSAVMRVFKTGQSEIMSILTDDMIKALNPKELKLIRALSLRSVMVVPICVNKKSVGVIQFISTSEDNMYTANDLSTAQQLAQSAALAIENALLFTRAKQAVTLRDEFISVASHELKTPITSLKVYAQILQQQTGMTHGIASQYLSKMSNQIEKMIILIQDLLDISRVEIGKLSFKYESFAVDDVVSEVAESLQATTQKLRIVVDGKTGVVMKGDKDRIGQVLINLLTNALKYSKGGQDVLVTVKKDDNKVSISVTDKGIGIDKKHLNKIFDRFYQVSDKKAKPFAGLGIGLYISREIIRRHGGELSVASIRGKGSTFTFTLPIS